ncbi:hypothetical protein A0H81_05788 [Grifola frondosa]|uniref:Uncharacterized protein n=1 Tax=Grifola frondosa TaxID=5627 RepID=A0A1C7MCB4_GRIFR|nr:hypothetical protein A0H81_05788 [Grifola frondosa]
MGPGSRRDLLDDIFAAHNWRKTCQFPSSLLAKIKAAVPERNEHVAAFEEFTSSLPPQNVAEWTALVEAWEHDQSAPNPFEITHHSQYYMTITQAAVRLELAQEDAARLKDGTTVVVHEQISGSTMVLTGLELEEHQRRLRVDLAAASENMTNLQHAKLLERQTALQRRIDAWFEIQQLYMPALARLRSRNNTTETAVQAQNVSLLLPAAASRDIVCDPFLLDYEWRLRYSNAFENLADLRRHLQLRDHLCKFKAQFIRGQRPNTRARSIVNTIQERIHADVARYRINHAALTSLAVTLNRSDWQRTLHPLADADVRFIADGEEDQTEGRRTMSWIWRTSPSESGTTEGLQESLRVEWCKARARAHRWMEEVDLLEEEMRRVKAFHAERSNWWLEQSGTRTSLASDLAEGVTAYAQRQAVICRSMHDHCDHTWRDVQQWLTVSSLSISVTSGSILDDSV